MMENSKKAEAVKRMRMWGIYSQITNDFQNKGLVASSEQPFGACFWLTDEQKARVQAFEEEYGALVYHVIHSYTDIGEMESYLYVSNYPEEWGMDHEDIGEGCAMAYVYNKTNPEYSEIGMIGVGLTMAAGLKRTH